MKHRLVAALAVGTLVVGAGAAGAAGYGTASTGGVVYVTDADIARAKPATETVEAPQAFGSLPEPLGVAAAEPTCTGSGLAWCATQTATGTVDIAVEASAPGGHALRFSTAEPSDGARLANTSFAGSPLAAISTLGYRTKTQERLGTDSQPPALNIELTVPDKGYVNVVWEPVYADAVGAKATGTWVSWSPSDARGWYATNESRADISHRSASFGEVKAALPGAVIQQISLNQGTGNDGVVAFVDLLRINDTTYDFENAPASTVVVRDADLACAAGAWCAQAADSATVDIVDDATAPGGSALRLATPSEASALTVTTSTDAPFSSLGTVSYATSLRQQGSIPEQLPALTLDISTSATPTIGLIYEPVYADPAKAKQEDIWQTWLASSGGGWWSFENRKVSNPEEMADLGTLGTLGFRQFTATLAEVQAALPAARVTSFGLRQGSSNGGLIAFADSLRMNGTTYDFQANGVDPAAATDGVVAKVLDTAPEPTTPVVTPPAVPATEASSSPSAAASPSTAASPQAEVTTSPAPSATPDPGASTPSPSEGSSGSGGSSSGSGGGSSSGSVSAAGASSSPTPSASTSTSASSESTASPAQPEPTDCRSATISLGRSTIVATGSTDVTWTAAPGSTALLYAYSQPSTAYAVVRRITVGDDGTARTQVRPGTNTRLYALQDGCATSFASKSVVLNVRTALTIAAKRNGVRDYAFSGDSLPARRGGLIVSLYRVTDDGRQVLTAQSRADARNGDWAFRRVFTGTGRFGFVVRTGQDLQNAPGASNVRSTLVY